MVALSLATIGVAAEDPGPLAVDPVGIDLGCVFEGTTRDLEFVITSTSDEPIRLRYIHTDCDCTLKVPADGDVPASGEFVLVAELDLADVDEGPFEELITVLTDHPHQPEILISITAQVLGHRDPGATGTAKERSHADLE